MISQVILPRGAREKAIDRITALCAKLDRNKAWRVEVHEQRPTRSSAQNRYLWGVCYPSIIAAGKLEGWSSDDLHEYFLGEHFGWEKVVGFGKTRLHPLRRSAKLNKMEFMDFIAFIQQRMAEHGIVIPDPDQEFTEGAA